MTYINEPINIQQLITNVTLGDDKGIIPPPTTEELSELLGNIQDMKLGHIIATQNDTSFLDELKANNYSNVFFCLTIVREHSISMADLNTIIEGMAEGKEKVLWAMKSTEGIDDKITIDYAYY